MVEFEVLQMTPADGWFALYEKNERRLLRPLACWALIREVGTSYTLAYIVGCDGEAEALIEGTIEICSNIPNFQKYIYAPLLRKE